jgi:hypothetical protein
MQVDDVADVRVVTPEAEGTGWRPTDGWHGWAKPTPDGHGWAVVRETEDGYVALVVAADQAPRAGGPEPVAARYGPVVFTSPAEAIAAAEAHLDDG